tara:strand:+ start:1028 stop:1144 length:117 start_codon:yes stop_codon:yes gene_type:complete
MLKKIILFFKEKIKTLKNRKTKKDKAEEIRSKDPFIYK